jgi:hypothetical protein
MSKSSPFSQSLGNQQREILLSAKPEDFDGYKNSIASLLSNASLGSTKLWPSSKPQKPPANLP